MSLTKLSESSTSDTTKSSSPGAMNRLSGTIAKVRITIDPEFRPYAPVLIPDLDAVILKSPCVPASWRLCVEYLLLTQ
ncbi:MAG: hypothetical protein WAV66_20920, partial [Anaerolineae bacterium]